MVDSLIKQLNDGGIYAQAYADDIVVLVESFFLETVFELTQEAIDSWAGGVEGGNWAWSHAK